MSKLNCPNCGAPLRHLTSGDICEYCGSSFPLSICQTVRSMSFQNYGASVSFQNYGASTCANLYSNWETQANLYSNAVNTIADYDKWRRFNIDAGAVFEWI